LSPTPDRFPGTREETEIKILPESSDPSEEGVIRLVSGNFRMRDGLGVFNPRSGSGGLTEGDHKVLDFLGHAIVEDAYEEITYTGSKVSNVTIWTDSGKTIKIREYQYTYSGSKISTETIIQYNGSGVEVERLVLTYTFTGNKVSSIDYEYSTP